MTSSLGTTTVGATGTCVPSVPPAANKTLALPDWRSAVAPYRESHRGRALFQLLSTWAAFFALWGAAYMALSVSVFLTLAIDVILAGVIVRLFVIQHDCGHESFFADNRANRLTGLISSALVLTPFGPWRRAHATHHATTGDLEKRGIGDVSTWTVAEYQAAGRFQRFGYRFIRNPLVILLIGPFAVFAVSHRIPGEFQDGKTRAVRLSVHLTTLANLVVIAFVFLVFGWRGFFLVHFPAGYLAIASGIFLFFVQHQYPEAYWRRGSSWNYDQACFDGCSHLELNPLLAWFSGDIGVHHLHHLAPRIPNYALRACLKAHPELKARTKLSLWQAIRMFRWKLYDEDLGRMVRFDDVLISQA